MKNFMNKRFYIFLSFFLCFSYETLALSEFKYLDKPMEGEKCRYILNEIDFPNPMPIDEGKFEVNLDFTVEDIFNIESKLNEYDALYQSWIYWKDPRLESLLQKLDFFDEQRFYLCSFSVDEVWGYGQKLWDPTIEIYNKKIFNNQKSYADWIEIFSDGTIQVRLREAATFISNFNFKKFPFDSQSFNFHFTSEYPIKYSELKYDKLTLKKHIQNIITSNAEGKFSGWKVNEMIACEYAESSWDGYNYAGVSFQIIAERETFYYIFKIIIPIFIILITSWTTFWLKPNQIESRITITIVAFLTLIAYNFVIDNELPKLNYLSYIDTFIFLSYLFASLATVFSVLSHYLSVSKNEQNGIILDLHVRKYGMILFFMLNLFAALYFDVWNVNTEELNRIC